MRLSSGTLSPEDASPEASRLVGGGFGMRIGDLAGPVGKGLATGLAFRLLDAASTRPAGG
jgi:hypothetical protein